MMMKQQIISTVTVVTTNQPINVIQPCGVTAHI